MELIPILSTIILVATISTFLLAIGAYILYKVRERRGQVVTAPEPSSVKAELITPATAPEQGRPAPTEQPIVVQQPMRQPAYAQAGQSVDQNVRPSYTVKEKTYYEPAYAQTGRKSRTTKPQRGYQGPSYASQGQENSKETGREARFLQYTTEGYVSAKEDKNAGALKWR